MHLPNVAIFYVLLRACPEGVAPTFVLTSAVDLVGKGPVPPF